MIHSNVAEFRLHREQYDEAARLLASSLALYRALRAMYPSSYAIDAAARLAARTGRPETAAVLLGAADGVRATIGVSVEGAHRVRRARLVEHVRAELGSAAFDEALAQGRGLRHEQAVDAAIDAVTAGLTAG